MLVGDGSVTCGTSYVVAAGDTLSRVSERAYGDPMLYGILADANWEALGGDPENLTVGMPLTVPCIDATGQTMTPTQVTEAAASMDAAVAAEGTLTPEQLDTLFGPIALFPDQVLTPVLVAVTFPLDVVKAARFVEETAELSDDDRAAQASDQPWDDSVRELAAGFPDLVTRMSENIDWTEQAGEAVVAQTDDVLGSIQRLRAKAQENGYLVDNDAQTVEEANDKIVIAPASPGVVYVPTYDPQVVYTTPVVGAPVYHYGYDDDWDDALVTGGIILGTAIVLDEIFDDDDWDGWDRDVDIDWDRGDITIDRDFDIDIDRGDRGDITIGGGDRQIGGGDRIRISDSDRLQVERGDLAGIRDGERRRAAAPPGDRTPISNAASREVARQKIEARKSAGVRPANLQPQRLEGALAAAGTRAATSGSRAGPPSRPSVRDVAASRPATHQRPAAHATSRSTAFEKHSGHRAMAASHRGRGSLGGHGGGHRRR